MREGDRTERSALKKLVWYDIRFSGVYYCVHQSLREMRKKYEQNQERIVLSLTSLASPTLELADLSAAAKLIINLIKFVG